MTEVIDDLDRKVIDTRVIKWRIAIILGVAILVGIIFILMDIPGGFFFTVFSTSGFTAYNFSSYVFVKGKNQLNNFICVGCLIWTLYILAGFFMEYHFLSVKGVIIYLIILVIYFLFYTFLKPYGLAFKNKSK